ncbi:hypothetical protein E2C01_013418 [Portunus trituberculatus]|uniref:Uncharacterized protein n=1 Tax=Portunus trituberculatus TaxID=210409 RepID=A0A5B7DH34_PORTR|nr:hypothetical protein [Portunus trituberculatus]
MWARNISVVCYCFTADWSRLYWLEGEEEEEEEFRVGVQEEGKEEKEQEGVERHVPTYTGLKSVSSSVDNQSSGIHTLRMVKEVTNSEPRVLLHCCVRKSQRERSNESRHFPLISIHSYTFPVSTLLPPLHDPPSFWLPLAFDSPFLASLPSVPTLEDLPFPHHAPTLVEEETGVCIVPAWRWLLQVKTAHIVSGLRGNTLDDQANNFYGLGKSLKIIVMTEQSVSEDEPIKSLRDTGLIRRGSCRQHLSRSTPQVLSPSSSPHQL